MFILIMAFLIISSILVLIAKRSKETLYIFGMCISLAILLSGVFLYIAKKGGISQELQHFFYFSSSIRIYFQYALITLNQLAYIVAIGRFLFPLFLLLMALHYAVIPWLKRNSWLRKLVLLPPVLSLIVYYPDIYYLLPGEKLYLTVMTQVWIMSYIIVSGIMLIHEAVSIQIRFIRRQFVWIVLFVLSLTILYLLYFGQEPRDIYQFYSVGISTYYIRAAVSVPAYLLVVTSNIVLSIIAFFGIFKYANGIFVSNREEIIIQRKFNSISAGTSVFVHSIKNQLLSNRIIHKRLNKQVQESDDITVIKRYIDQLSDQNEMMLSRIEELYRSVKADHIRLIPVYIQDVTAVSIKKFNQKYPHKTVQVEIENERVLADPAHLSEAIYNLLINAEEAVQAQSEGAEGNVYLHCFPTRQYTVIEVRDDGTGISKKEMNHLFDPFYSSKNSNHNWGMGLHYVRNIVTEHFGELRYESALGKGSTFFMLLPRMK